MEVEVNMKKEKIPKTKPVYGMWSNTCFMLRIAWQTRKSVIWIAIILSLITLVGSLINLYITPSILKLVEDNAALSHILIAILLFSVAMISLDAILSYLNTNKMYGRISVRMVIVQMINDKFSTTSYINLQSQEFLQKTQKARETVNSNSSATESIWETLSAIISHVLRFMIYLVLLSNVHWIIVVVTIVTAMIGYVIATKTNEWQYYHMEEGTAYSQKMEYLNRISKNRAFGKDIRIFSMKDWLDELYTKTLRAYDSFWIKGEKIRFIGNLTDALFSFLRNGVAYAYLIALVLENGLSASEFLLYFSAVGGFTTWVTGLLGDFATLHKQSVDLSMLREFLNWKEPFAFEDGEPLDLPTNTPCEIKLENVTFTYPDADKPTIKNLNLTIRAGEKLAVVGLNGAGKTTLVKLICGFFHPDEGCVLLNGVDIRTYNRHDYYRHIVAIFQEFSVLAASIEENVAQTRTNIDKYKVKQCIERAGLTEVILKLPQQYETKIGKEVYEDAPELSGGEMQRLMLARTIYKEVPIMVLDEPTAALDPIAESKMYQRYNDLTEGRTSIYISHRLASTRFCDRIILLEDGGIKEEGTHEQLMKQNGSYAKLFDIQSHYYQENIKESEEEA